jgi:hypothetical protein
LKTSRRILNQFIGFKISNHLGQIVSAFPQVKVLLCDYMRMSEKSLNFEMCFMTAVVRSLPECKATRLASDGKTAVQFPHSVGEKL